MTLPYENYNVELGKCTDKRVFVSVEEFLSSYSCLLWSVEDVLRRVFPHVLPNREGQFFGPKLDKKKKMI